MSTEEQQWIEQEEFKDRVEVINYNNRRFDLLSTALPTSAITLIGAGMRVLTFNPWVLNWKLPQILISVAILILLLNYLSYYYAMRACSLDHELTMKQENSQEGDDRKKKEHSNNTKLVNCLNMGSLCLMIVLAKLLLLIGWGISGSA